MTIAKHMLEKVAKFAVMTELYRRNIPARLGPGLRNRTEVSVTKRKVLRIEIHGKQTKTWPGCKGPNGRNILILVDFENKKDDERPDFYILTLKDWRILIQHELRDELASRKVIRGPNDVPEWPTQPWEGLAVKPRWVVAHKERWDKIR